MLLYIILKSMCVRNAYVCVIGVLGSKLQTYIVALLKWTKCALVECSYIRHCAVYNAKLCIYIIMYLLSFLDLHVIKISVDLH